MVVLAILATITLPAYFKTQEHIFDNQAKADLKLIIVAEKNYNFDMGYYYYSSDITLLNNNLGLNLPAASNRKWNYSTALAGSACAQATRTTGTVRYWHMHVADTEPVNTACS
jgi:Tfp pilus assembly protein PilE